MIGVYIRVVRRLLFMMLGALAGGGCAAPRGSTADIRVEPGQYAEAFDAAREALRDCRFEVDRVDAQAGVITTHPKTTGGIATPWDPEQSSLGQEFGDLAYANRRVARVAFGPVEPERAESRTQVTPAPAPPDLRDADTPLIANVWVVVEREQSPGRRLDARAIRLGSQTQDPDVAARRMWPRYGVAIERDMELEKRIAEAIRHRLDQ